MIKTFENVNRNKLHIELQGAGIETEYVLAINNTEIGCKIMFANDVDMETVQQIIDTHDPTPLPEPLTEIERLRLEQAQSNSETIDLMMAMMGGM